MKKLNISVLIIDKNKEIQKQLCSSLENIVNTIYFADTCKSAYNIYKISKIDLIISSKEEPISNNLDFFKEIRKEQINLPFVICVNKDDSDFLVEFIKLKSIHFLIKPLNIEDLKFIIDSLSELKCKNEELIFQNNLFNQYKNIVDISNLVSKADKNGKITFVNKEFCRISGFSEEDLIGKNYNIIRHPLMRKEIFKEMWTTIQKKNIWRGIIHNKSKNGET